jgi:serine/threonine protein phosphatase PrpC
MLTPSNRRKGDRMSIRTAAHTPTSSIDPAALKKPLPDEIDVFGVTHQGKVRKNNADHFLVASFHRAMRVHASSLPPDALPPFSKDSRGFLFLVADGVGGLTHAEHGSAQVTDAVARYLVDMGEISLATEPQRESEVVERLRTSVGQAHARLCEFALEAGGAAATTITMLIAIWPRAFIVHAGDSRAYRLRDGVLEQMTTDQTMAQVMVDAGAMSRETADASRLKHVLVSAVGSSPFDMQVVALDLRRNDRIFLCTDGLTRHVSDAEIRDHVASDVGAERVCRDLLQLALDRGGDDNITIVTGRARS